MAVSNKMTKFALSKLNNKILYKMNKTEYYTKFVNEVQNMIFTFISDYNIPSSCKLQQNIDDDIQWTLNLGENFGSINIIIESWEHAKYNGKVNVCSIPMKFHTYRDNEKLFSMRSGGVNPFDGKFVLRARSNAVKTLLNDFSEVLTIWSYMKQKRTNNAYVSLN